MSNEEHLSILKQGVRAWNTWREAHPDIIPDLRGADLSKGDLSWIDLHAADLGRVGLSDTKLSGANLRDARLHHAALGRAYLFEADLQKADLTDAVLSRATLSHANLDHAILQRTILNESLLGKATLRGADLRRASLSRVNLAEADLENAILEGAFLDGADLRGTSFNGANLIGAELTNVVMVETQFVRANLTGCCVFGTSAWNVNLTGAIQSNLRITQGNEPSITIDDLEIAQFVYLLLNNAKIRNVIDIVGKKAVLILGRFTTERKVILEAIRDTLRQRDYLPILFDFDRSISRNLTETVSTLAHLSRFIIADITDPRSTPQELQAIVPHLPSVPVQPLLNINDAEYTMFEDFLSYQSVLPMYRYASLDQLLAEFESNIIAPAEQHIQSNQKRSTYKRRDEPPR